MMEKQAARAKAAAQTKHSRWLFYLLFAALAGGKVANATAKVTKIESGVAGLGDRRNVRALADVIWMALRFVGRLLGVLLSFTCWLVKQAISSILHLSAVAWRKLENCGYKKCKEMLTNKNASKKME
jgi:hypothetical protein